MKLVTSTRTPMAPASLGNLATAGCTCGMAPRVACFTCARWLRIWRQVTERRRAWGRGQ